MDFYHCQYWISTVHVSVPWIRCLGFQIILSAFTVLMMPWPLQYDALHILQSVMLCLYCMFWTLQWNTIFMWCLSSRRMLCCIPGKWASLTLSICHVCWAFWSQTCQFGSVKLRQIYKRPDGIKVTPVVDHSLCISHLAVQTTPI